MYSICMYNKCMYNICMYMQVVCIYVSSVENTPSIYCFGSEFAPYPSFMDLSPLSRGPVDRRKLCSS